MSDALIKNYARLDVTFSRGEGVWLWDEDGRQYLDALSGIAVCGLGHAHPAVADAVSEQARELVHTSNLYRIGVQERLAERLCTVAGMERVFFCNSGAEANEAAIKIARAHGSRRGVEAPAILVAEGSFHGRTLGALSATGNPKVKAGFGPIVEGFVQAPFGDAEAFESAGDRHPDTCAVLVEPILGEGGVVMPQPGFLRRLREICDARGWLLMLDEVQTGMGRTGQWFACQHAGVRPDVMSIAKALGNGVPIGACLARGEAAEALQPGSHGSTFGGNPLACSAALAVVDTMERDGLVEAAAVKGRHLRKRLQEALAGQNCVVEVRGQGLMVAIEVNRSCGEMVGMALARGLLINVTADRVIRLLPPLILEDEHVERIAQTLAELVREWNA
jgi:acetylornithine aminotransferase